MSDLTVTTETVIVGTEAMQVDVVGVTDLAPDVVEVVEPGPPGPPGPKGDQGPAGPPAGAPFIYQWDLPMDAVTVQHNRNDPGIMVRVYDLAGYEVVTGVRIIDNNSLEITMASPMAGRAVVI